MSLVTLALLFGLTAFLISVGYAIAKAIELYRSARDLLGGLGEATERLGVSLERLASFEPPDVGALSDSTARLQASQARLSIQLGALRRVREQWGALLAIYPRK